MAKIQFKGKEGGGFVKITEGIYDLQVVKCSLETSKKDDGGPVVVVEFKVVDGEFASETIPKWIGTDEKQGWVLRKLLEATGTPYEMDPPEPAEGEVPTITFDDDDLLQRFVRAKISPYYNEKTKKTYNNIDDFEVSAYQQAAEGGGQATETKTETESAGVRRGRAQA